MVKTLKPAFPGGSRSRVNRAGDNVRKGNATSQDLQVIDEWRAAHRGVLNTFQAILRNRTRGTGITVAQRHKRKRTIFDKLHRLPGMQLARMDDVAGFRLIFKNLNGLNDFRATFHRAHFKHKRRNDLNKYDYIKQPKETGYRGIHDVYEYDVNPAIGQNLAGLNVEIQYRTLVQHAWATARDVSNRRNTILIFSDSGELEIRTFRDAPDALRALFELERTMPERDIVLVRADTSEEVRLAFRNYFSDARDFIRLLEDGCAKLTVHPSKKHHASVKKMR